MPFKVKKDLHYLPVAAREIACLVRIAAPNTTFEMLPGGSPEWQPQWRVRV
jgi:hypothetical protein